MSQDEKDENTKDIAILNFSCLPLSFQGLVEDVFVPLGDDPVEDGLGDCEQHLCYPGILHLHDTLPPTQITEFQNVLED